MHNIIRNSHGFKAHRKTTYVVIAAMLALAMFFLTSLNAAHAHPEDDFCGPDMTINQELCWKLSELNSGEAKSVNPIKDEAGNVLSPMRAAIYFMKIGVQHILPGGTDHILFVLGLFLAAKTLRDLILQISVFTVAHTVTLGMTAVGIIEPPTSVVEPLIALSIVIVAIEALLKANRPKWRFLIIFGFGLFHGMGFAGFIGEIGLPPEQFWPSLIGFNVGVEIGQLAVILLAALLCLPAKHWLAETRIGYRGAVVVPVSLLIAVIGFWWFVTRSLGL